MNKYGLVEILGVLRRAAAESRLRCRRAFRASPPLIVASVGGVGSMHNRQFRHFFHPRYKSEENRSFVRASRKKNGLGTRSFVRFDGQRPMICRWTFGALGELQSLCAVARTPKSVFSHQRSRADGNLESWNSGNKVMASSQVRAYACSVALIRRCTASSRQRVQAFGPSLSKQARECPFPADQMTKNGATSVRPAKSTIVGAEPGNTRAKPRKG